MFETRALAVMAGLCAGAAAHAADLDVQVRTASGGPVRDAVVTLHLVRQPTPLPKANGSYAIDQQNIQFHPFVSVVPVGANVAFMNHDAVRHHVYSFSEAKRFELKVGERQVNRVVNFDKAGIVPLGCNIHDRMIAFLDVVDTPWAEKTDAAGNADFRGVPASGVTIDVWHPYLRAPGNHTERAATLAAGPARREVFTVALRSPPRLPDAGY
jgi:plastocyanin